MKYKSELDQLTKLPYFDQITLGNLLGISGQTLQMYITRAVARGQFIRLKRSLYVTGDYYRLEFDKEGYSEFLSNVIYGTAYLSLGYILQKYAILTEAVFAYTAVTVKKTMKIINKTGSYLYTNIKEDQFAGFEIVNRGRYRIRQATKAKALYDYLYFEVKKWESVKREIVNGLRFNLDEMDQNSWNEFCGYVNRLGGEKMKKIEKILCNQ